MELSLSHLRPLAPPLHNGPPPAPLGLEPEAQTTGEWTIARPPTRAQAVVNVFHAARMMKNLPLLLLLLGGALTAPAQVHLPLLACAGALTLVASAFMTHINILTDARLDREKKPQLLRWLASDPLVMRAALVTEGAVTVLGLIALACFAPFVALGVFVFTLLTILYSYNFLAPSKAVQWRFKAHWWGHLLVCVGAYLALWLAGHFCSGGSTPASALLWLPMFFFVSLSEYSLFLSESAVDATEERRAGLNTFATLLGRHGSSVLALGVWLISAAGALASVKWLGLSALIAFGPGVGARGLTELLLALKLKGDERVRFRLPDLVFWGGRLATVGALAILTGART